MQIQITNGHIKLTRLLKEHIERRVGLALGRFAERIGIVNVSFTPGITNGSDKKEALCHVEVRMRKKVRVEAAHEDVFAAVDRALENATRSVARILEQETGTVKPSPTRRAGPKA